VENVAYALSDDDVFDVGVDHTHDLVSGRCPRLLSYASDLDVNHILGNTEVADAEASTRLSVPLENVPQAVERNTGGSLLSLFLRWAAAFAETVFTDPDSHTEDLVVIRSGLADDFILG